MYKQNYIIILWFSQPTWISPWFLDSICFFWDYSARKIQANPVPQAAMNLPHLITAIFAWYFYALLLFSFIAISFFVYRCLIARLDHRCCFLFSAFYHQRNRHLSFGRGCRGSCSWGLVVCRCERAVASLLPEESPRFSTDSCVFTQRLEFHMISARSSISLWARQRFTGSDILNALSFEYFCIYL